MVALDEGRARDDARSVLLSLARAFSMRSLTVTFDPVVALAVTAPLECVVAGVSATGISTPRAVLTTRVLSKEFRHKSVLDTSMSFANKRGFSLMDLASEGEGFSVREMKGSM